MRPLLIAMMATIGFTTIATRAADITVQRLSPDVPAKTFDRIDFAIDPGQTYANPFDPDQVAIDATFTGPRGQTLAIPAFWDDRFVVRFAPTAPGRWSMTAAARDKTGRRESAPIGFDVAESSDGDLNRRGFIRRAPGNPRYFQYDSGEPYFVIGLNLAWPNRDGGTQQIDEWFARLSEHGGNWARIWMCHPPVMIENNKTGIGRYDLDSARYFDRILESAQQRGVGVMLCFINHRDFIERDRWGGAIWPVNPYNAATGGPATRPADFFTDAKARQAFKRRLRYLVARYAAFTSMMCWELINEQEFARCPVPDAWNAEMAAELKRIDAYRHLVSTSSNLPDAVWRDENMDLTQRHIYGDGSITDLIVPVASAPRMFDRFAKPHLLAEFGIDFKGSDIDFDPAGRATTLHNALWAAAMSGAAGGACHWWWDNYIDKLNLWPAYGGIAKFAARVDWPRRQFNPIALPPPQHASTAAAGDETFTDLTIPASGGWGKSHGQPIDIGRNGQAGAEIPKFLYGSRKPELRTTTTFVIDQPRDGNMTLHVARVSDYSLLRIRIDGQPVADFAFSALPNSPDNANAKQLPEDPETWQADVWQDRRVPLAAGKHTIAIDNIAGDWVSIDSVTFTNARSSRYPPVLTLALQDSATGETLVWLCDAASNWKTDQDAAANYTTFDNLALTVPMPNTSPSKPMTIEWWDTRKGEIVARQQTSPADGSLRLTVPPFTRDIAARIAP